MVPSDSESPEDRYALGPTIIGDPTLVCMGSSYLIIMCVVVCVCVCGCASYLRA